MTYGKIIYMIAYLVSLEAREISYLFNTNNKYHKGEDTPRHILSKYICRQFSVVCFQVFDKFSRHLEKLFQVQTFLPTWLVKISFSPKDF